MIMTKKRRTINLKTVIRNTAFLGFSLFIVFYAVLKTRDIARGVDLQVIGIQNGFKYKGEVLEISGNAKNSKHLLVNGREVYIDILGDFYDTLVLLPGYNIIAISAEDRFGKVTRQNFEIIKE